MTIAEQIAEIVERIARVAAGLAIVIACAVMVHQHSHQADRAPYVAVDDSLANISASMNALGRNGFPASPIQAGAGTSDPRRHSVQINYGYAPFLLGAALDWLFGTSYPALRAIHVGGLILSIGAAWLVFRRTAPIAPIAFAGIVAILLWPRQWPMFRPDIGTALSGIAAIACATVALRRNGLSAWFGTGFFAATAFASHQIAWTMVPWAALIWLVSVALTEPGRRLSDITIGPFLAIVAGGLSGLLLYVIGIGWRLGDVAAMWGAYSGHVANAEKLSYLTVLAKHFQSAWAAVPSSQLLLLQGGLGLAASLSIVALWWRRETTRDLVAIALPAALAAILYLGGLGFYPNWHSGYVILLQLSTAWAAAASLAAIALLVLQRWPTSARATMTAAVLLGTVLLASYSHRLAKAGTVWNAATESNVSFSEYEGRVFAEVPQGASAIGSIIFGLESGKRHHLVQLSEGIVLLDHVGPANRERMLPDHIIINSEMADLLRIFNSAAKDMRLPKVIGGRGLLGDGGPFNRSADAYGETSIVSAEPYGDTRVLTRRGIGTPAVAVYDSVTRTWATRTAPATALDVKDAKISVSVAGSSERHAAIEGLAVRVEPGIYLVEVDISGQRLGSAIVTGSPTPDITINPNSVNPFGPAGAGLAFNKNATVHVLLRAPTGEGFIGYFGDKLDRKPTIRSMARVLAGPARQTPVALPTFDRWSVQAKGMAVSLAGDGRSATFVEPGLPVGYLISSPPIAVAPNALLTIKFDLEATGGRVGLGALDRKGQWIGSVVERGPLTFNTGDNTQITLVLTSLENTLRPAPARFRLQIDEAFAKVSYSPQRPYVDELARCFALQPKGVPLDACR